MSCFRWNWVIYHFFWKNGFKCLQCSFISFAFIFPLEMVVFFLLLNLNHLNQIRFTKGWVIERFKCLQCSFVSFYIIFPLEMGIFFLLNLNYLDQIPFTPGWIILNVNWMAHLLLKREWKFWMAKMGRFWSEKLISVFSNIWMTFSSCF